jgi:hypothetical protein
VQNSVLFDEHVSLSDFPKVCECLILREASLLPKQPDHIATPTKLRNDVDVVLSHEDVQTADNVWMFELAQCSHFIVEEVTLHLVLNLREFHHLDSYVILCDLVLPSIHNRTVAPANLILLVEHEVLNFLREAGV